MIIQKKERGRAAALLTFLLHIYLDYDNVKR